MSEQRPIIVKDVHYPTIKEYLPCLRGENLKIGIVTARFNADFCKRLLASCVAELRRLGVADANITIATVPGALEIPLTLQNMAQSYKFHALIAFGCVIRGDTYHFEVVCNDACRGVMDVQLNTGVPIANGILTCNTAEQAEMRVVSKGEDCAKAAIEMAHLNLQLNTSINGYN